MSLKRFFQDQSAQIAILAALVAVPVCAGCGLALDHHHTSDRKQTVQMALDASVMAAAHAKHSGADDLHSKVAVHQFLIPQLLDLNGLSCKPPDVTLDPSDSLIEADMECTQSTRLRHLIGHPAVHFTVSARSDFSYPFRQV